MFNLISKLGTEDWRSSAEEIYKIVKDELTGNKGYIKKVRNETDVDRRNKLETARKNLILDIANLDETLNQYTDEMYKINSSYEFSLQHDFTSILNQYSLLCAIFPNTAIIKDYLNNSTNFNLEINNRLLQILSRIITESITQSKKSNAGIAAETVMEVVAEAAGLESGKHYRGQFKSHIGSDTDFVFPNVEDYKDQDVEIFIAVQFTTNDRARLVTSELKEGGSRYVVSCNGMRAAKKSLKDIGEQILETFKSRNYILVCYEPELNIEKERCKEMGSNKRLDYFENYAKTFSEFAKKLNDRYATQIIYN
jgi:hypothetical protein